MTLQRAEQVAGSWCSTGVTKWVLAVHRWWIGNSESRFETSAGSGGRATHCEMTNLRVSVTVSVAASAAAIAAGFAASFTAPSRPSQNPGPLFLGETSARSQQPEVAASSPRRSHHRRVYTPTRPSLLESASAPTSESPRSPRTSNIRDIANTVTAKLLQAT